MLIHQKEQSNTTTLSASDKEKDKLLSLSNFIQCVQRAEVIILQCDMLFVATIEVFISSPPHPLSVSHHKHIQKTCNTGNGADRCHCEKTDTFLLSFSFGSFDVHKHLAFIRFPAFPISVFISSIASFALQSVCSAL